MILLDDNFATIVKAVSEGRRIYDNIRKFVKYIMTCNSAEILTIVSAPLLGMPIPLLPIHILWINLVTDGVPGLALAREQAEKDVMDRPPRPTNESFFSRGVGVHIIWAGIFMAAVTLGVQYWAIHFAGKEEGVWRTMVFFVLSVAQLGHIMGIKSEKELLIKQGIFSNFPLFLAVFGTLLLQIAIVYLPIANEIFKTTPLSMEELAISLCAGSLVFFAVEIEKLIRNRH
jgi:Ca2+-transporting ATPase